MKLNTKTFLIVILIVAITVMALVYVSGKNGTKPPVPSSKKTQTNVDSKKWSMEQSVKATFSSAADKNIISFINLASNEKDGAKRYGYYVKAYNLMIASHNKSKKPAALQAITNLKIYAGSLAGYKTTDFPIQK